MPILTQTSLTELLSNRAPQDVDVLAEFQIPFSVFRLQFWVRDDFKDGNESLIDPGRRRPEELCYLKAFLVNLLRKKLFSKRNLSRNGTLVWNQPFSGRNLTFGRNGSFLDRNWSFFCPSRSFLRGKFSVISHCRYENESMWNFQIFLLSCESWRYFLFSFWIIFAVVNQS